MGYSAGMSSRRIRLLLAFCLALALPLQGLAAARMLWCHGGILPSPVASAVQGLEDAEGAAAALAAADLPAEASAHPAPCHDGGAPIAATAAATDLAQSCAHCTACSLGAALPAAVPALPDGSLPSRAVTALPAAQAPAFLTDGPERPPRTRHA